VLAVSEQAVRGEPETPRRGRPLVGPGLFLPVRSARPQVCGTRYWNAGANWPQVNGFRDTPLSELRRADVAGDVLIESTEEGRMIAVRTPDVDALPDGFGSTVPSTAFTIIETDDLIRQE
jgi:hypothetical protein